MSGPPVVLAPGMRAVGVTVLGSPELEVLDLPEPHAGPGQVRVRVHYAAGNPTDTGFVAGAYCTAEQRPGPYVPGMDASGVVSEVGEGAPFAVGDRVMALVVPQSDSGGAYADEVVLPAGQVTRCPTASTWCPRRPCS